ncbi:MAG: nucleoside-diphosphate kinase [Candidatus Delongbacteria bacterium]|nr:nucleoside-diphosphate kinase [Candidatus Delongbacteria bacterium]MBN2836499.1 nucleoside-diphosphate kinase [Candidatus Delongbacteria bacterium]
MKQVSLLIIKPFAFRNKKVGRIISMIEDGGFDILGMKELNLTKRLAERFYEIHSNKSFFDGLTTFMSSDKIVAICVEKDNCIEDLRKLVGNTDPRKAEVGTIRHEVGTDIEANGVHASDSEENARNEIRFFFSALEVLF